MLIIFTISAGVFAQKTLNYEDLHYEYNAGLDLFSKQKYAVAQKHFETVIEKCDGSCGDLISESEYFSALCAIELFNRDAEYKISAFISTYPESPRVKTAYFQMGRFQFRKNKYSKAVKWFEMVDVFDLSNEESAEFYFKKGYSYFSMQKFDKANRAFYEIKDVDTKYTIPAVYYYSHIEYLNGNYQTALQGFERISGDEMFAPVVPYYITQIYFYQGKYDRIIEYAPALMDSASTKRTPEIARVIGEAYYRTFKYKEAIPYLELFMDKGNTISREDYYKIGYCYYRNEEYEKASRKFSSIANDADSLAQNAYYHLSDCYLKMDKREKAMYAFKAAAELGFDKKITESALFNFAVLSYELSRYPFNEAVKAFTQYIDQFPKTGRVDEALNYLVKVFMTTKNYKDALASIESIKNKTPDVALVYQRIAYYRGLELFNDLEFRSAIQHFDMSLNNLKLNPVLKAQAMYWKAEAYYRLRDYESASKNYEDFVLSDGAFELPEYKVAHYNLGYSYFKKKKYDDAIMWYRKYIRFMEPEVDEKVADALNRVGDCYFISRKYEDAILYYDKSVSAELKDPDYALYQKGFALGLLKEYNKKIIALSELLNNYSKSAYRPAASYELAKSYMVIESPEMAVSTYQTIIDEFPNTSYVTKAYLGMGLLQYNSGKNEEALKTYKTVIEKYKGNPEVEDAMVEIKKIYLDMNDVESYVAYTKSVGGLSISETEEDSLMFMTAEKIYLKGDCDDSKSRFQKYIDKFGDGKYLLGAHYYKADCNMKAGEENDALTSYEAIISRPKTKFTEPSLLNAARIYYKRKDFGKASALYGQLEQIAELKSTIKEARIGKMRCDITLGKPDEIVSSAIRVLKTDKIEDEIKREAHYNIAKSYMKLGKNNQALDEFQVLAQDCKSKEGAEAKYMIAEIYLSQGKDSLAEQEVLDFSKQMTPHKYWVAKGYVLLSDVYLKRKDYFYAKAMLYSVITNYDNRKDGIIEIAEDKLEDIIVKEDAERLVEESIEDVEVEFGGNIELYQMEDEVIKGMDEAKKKNAESESESKTDNENQPENDKQNEDLENN